MWHFYQSQNANWSTEGIEDTQIEEIDWKGKNQYEQDQARLHKIDSLLNLAACCLKSHNYTDCVQACNHVLTLDPDNIQALHRRAKATYLPVNSSVEDMMAAVKDLTRVA